LKRGAKLFGELNGVWRQRQQWRCRGRICSFTVALLTKYRPAMVFTSVYFEKN